MTRSRTRLCGELQRLGLSAGQADLLLDVLRQGGVGALDRSPEAEELAALGLIRPEVDEQGRSFLVATRPRIAVTSLVRRTAWQTSPLGAGQGTEWPGVPEDDARDSFRDLVSGMEALLHGSDTPALVSYDDESSFSAALVDAIASSSEQIRGVTAEGWLPNVALVWTSVCDALDRGVPYRRLSDLNTWIAWGHAINRRDVEVRGVDVRLTLDPIVDKCFIIDGQSAFVFETGESEGRFATSGTMLRNRLLVGELSGSFDTAWTSGVRAVDAIQAGERVRRTFLLHAGQSGPDAARVAERVYDYGVYCSLDARERLLADALIECGLLRDAGTAFGAHGCVAPHVEGWFAAELGAAC